VPRLTVQTTVVPALLRNDAGIIGAAIIAAEAPIGRPMERPVYPIGEPADARGGTADASIADAPVVNATAADASTADAGAPS
jgi:hypothetical protein